MAVQFKAGVVVDGVQPETLQAIAVAHHVLAGMDYACTITSVMDGRHMQKSKHYQGHAFDLRRRHIPEADVPAVAARLRQALGRDFDVVVEATHFHIEFDPKGA